MYRQDEQSEEKVVRKLNSQERFYIYINLEMMIVHDHLVDDSSQHQEGYPHGDDEHESFEFTQEHDPSGHWCGVGKFIQPCFAFAPDELIGIKDGE